MRQITRIASRVCAKAMSTRRRLVFKEHLWCSDGTYLSATPKAFECEGNSGLAYLLREGSRCTGTKYIVVLAFDYNQDAAIETACNKNGLPAVGRKQPDT